MFEEYFDDTRSLLELKSFNQKWGDGWDCCDFVERRPKEDVERCQEAVKSIIRSVVAPAFDAKWESYQPHQNLLDNLAGCMKQDQRLKGEEPQSAIEGTSNSNISLRVRALLNLATRHGEYFHNVLKDTVLVSNGEYQRGPRKLSSRILEKAKDDYDGDVSRVVDVERGTGIYDSSDDLAKAVITISNLCNNNFSVVRIKKSFSKTSHYRDVKFNIRIKGLVGELKLCLRNMDQWNKKTHNVYRIERVIMNKKPKAAPHHGLASVPALRFTRDDGVSIADGDCLEDLQKKLESVLPEGCTFTGGYLSNNTVNVYLGVTNIASFAKLRDTIILPNNKFDLALAPFRVDTGAFIDLYAINLMKFVKLTSHQEEQLKNIRGAKVALLLAPAGTGKTFVAIQCMLEAIQDGDHVLFAAPTLSLVLFVVRWLVLASGKHVERILDKVRVLIDKNGWEFANGPLRVIVVDNDGRQSFTVEKPIDVVPSYAIVVVDEAHHVVGDVALQEQLQKIKTKKYLFLGDVSQSIAKEEFTEDRIQIFLDLPNSQTIVVAKLTEVVRSTKRIVAGASLFQLTSASKTETKTHASSEGFPLVPHLFAPVSADEQFKTYAFNIVQALKKMKKNLNDVNLDDRVMIICPDDNFVEELRLPLLEELRSQMNEQYNLVSALHASAALPLPPSINITDHPCWLVVDSIDKVDGLERLVVIATGLDKSIQETEGDIHTRSALYRALTRAQLAVAVVNEHVQDSFLEFLRGVKFNDDDFNEKKVKLQLSSTDADDIQAKAVKKTSAIEISRDKKSISRREIFKNISIKISSYKESRKSIQISRRENSSKPNESRLKKAVSKVIRKIIRNKNTIHLTSQGIWDTRETAEITLKNYVPKFMPLSSEMSLKDFRLSTSNGLDLSKELTKKRVACITLDNKKIGEADVTTLADALKINTSVTSIDLNFNKIGGAGAMVLAEAIKVNTGITSIELQCNDIDDAGAIALAWALKVNMTMTSIDLSSNRIGDAGITALAEALKVNATVTRIDLCQNRIGDEGATVLAEALKKNASLISIDLDQNKIGDEGATMLAEALKENRKMNSIGLSSNKIGDEGATMLAEALKENRKMNSIGLSSNKIGVAGVTALAKALKINTSITSIDLSFNKIGDTGATVLAEALKGNTAINSIDLSSNGIGDAGAMVLAKAIVVNTSMTIIGLTFNKIGAAGATAMAEALVVNLSMTRIDLSSNRIGDVGATAFAEALKVNTSMTRIELSSNKIGDAGATAFAEALKVNTSMTRIGLSSNKINGAGAIAFAEALKVNTSMTSINLISNKIGDVGAMALAKALKVNTSMTSISLISNKIGDVGATALAKALKVNTTLINMSLFSKTNAVKSEELMVIATLINMNEFDDIYSRDCAMSHV